MKKSKVIFIVFFVVISILIASKVNAAEITSSSEILLGGEKISSKVTDNKEGTYITVGKGKEITIKSSKDIYSVYIVYEYSSKAGTLSGNEKTADIGENNFLHEFIDVKEKIGITNEFKLSYNADVKIDNIYVLGEGEVPDFVEKWEKPCEVADLVLFSTHSDDEQLFFLGLLPTYVARGAYVQVVYFANHNDNPMRLHEQLHGLYTVGIRHYPVMGIVPDAWATSRDGAIKNLRSSGLTEEDAKKFQVEMIRRFKPQVVVGHDEKGEYSHGQHILNTYLLEDAILKANDATYDTESASKYGTWQISKLYLHLYEKNQIKMDYDTPLDYFGGKTAYEVSKQGYSKHISQQWTWFTKWINGANNSYKKATEITTYSPLIFGLYYTNVGEDVQKNDMLENIVYYKEQIKAKEEEEQRRKEEEEKKNNSSKENKKADKEEKGNKSLKWIVIVGVVLVAFFMLKKKATKKKKHSKKRKK